VTYNLDVKIGYTRKMSPKAKAKTPTALGDLIRGSEGLLALEEPITIPV
jgi:hypothetical protein